MFFEGVVGAPWREVADGAQINLTSNLFPIWKEEGNFIFTGPDSLSKWGGTILAVSGDTQISSHVFGSAVLVAPGVAITAAHVVDEFQRLWNAPGSTRGPLICMGLLQGRVMLWAVKMMHTVKMGEVITDICILELEARTPLPQVSGIPEISSAVITTEIPKPGDLVQVLGFRAHSPIFTKNGNTTIMNYDLFLSVAKVSEVFLSGQMIFPAPSFIVNCPTVGGQSGGPIFDKVGRLVGILSMGSNQYGRGSLILPALAVPLCPSWPPKFYQKPKCLFEMDACNIFGKDKVEFQAHHELGLFGISPKFSGER